MLDLRNLGLEGIERLCQADLSWKLVPLYDCPGKERKGCVVLVCSQLAILVLPCLSVNKNSHQWQQGGFVFYRGWLVWNPLFFVKGIANPDYEACQIR